MVAAAAGAAPAHTVVVDGLDTDWSTRAPTHGNAGIIARASGDSGEYVFVDATGDHRTDPPSSSENDLTRVQITGDALNLYVLVKANGTSTEAAQVQVSIDTDRINGFGQNFLAGFADTTVSEDARWEFLVQTQLNESPAGTGAHVYNTAFDEVASAVAVQNLLTGDVELSVAWASLGLAGPPTSALRFTVSTYVATGTSDTTSDLGGAGVSNALDAIGDCGNPRSTGFPNAWDCDLSDADIDYYADVWFEADGDVYPPLVVSHYLTDAAAGTSTEFVAIRNLTPSAYPLVGVKVGDEEVVDATTGVESFFTAPALSIAAGDVFIVAQNGLTYESRFGEPADAELGGATGAPDMVTFAEWFNGSTPNPWGLNNAGDQILVLDASNTIIDVALYGNGAYAGVGGNSSVPGDDVLMIRTPATGDTDDNAVDFVLDGVACEVDTDCGASAGCSDCTDNVCSVLASGASCGDGNLCNGDETCNGAGGCDAGVPVTPGTSCSDGDVCNGDEFCSSGGICDPGTPLTCADTDPCTADECDPVTGCGFPDAADGTACPDADACNGDEVCGAGECLPGAAPTCDDSNPCTSNTCDPATGCAFPNLPMGTDCADADLCDGAETCDMTGTCAAGTPVDCSDEDPCNGDETCTPATGACVPGTPPVCPDDLNACTADGCLSGVGCVSTPLVGDVCNDDGDACNGVSLCDADGNCVAGAPVDCPPTGTVCATNTCDPATGACNVENAGVGTDCDDGDPCNGVDTCDGDGACAPGPAPIDGGVCDPTLDAGPSDAGGSDAGDVGDAGGAPDAYIPGGDDDGCGCRAGGPSRSPGGAVVLALAGLFIVVSRRRKS